MKHNLDAHLSERRKTSSKSAEDLHHEAWLLCVLVEQLSQMGHGTSIAAKLLHVSHSRLVSKLHAFKKGRLPSIEPATAEQIEEKICLLSRLPSTPEEGQALLKKVLDAYGREGVGTLSSLASYLGVCRALLFRWRAEPPKKVKIETLIALQSLDARGLP